MGVHFIFYKTFSVTFVKRNQPERVRKRVPTYFLRSRWSEYVPGNYLEIEEINTIQLRQSNLSTVECV